MRVFVNTARLQEQASRLDALLETLDRALCETGRQISALREQSCKKEKEALLEVKTELRETYESLDGLLRDLIRIAGAYSEGESAVLAKAAALPGMDFEERRAARAHIPAQGIFGANAITEYINIGIKEAPAMEYVTATPQAGGRFAYWNTKMYVAIPQSEITVEDWLGQRMLEGFFNENEQEYAQD